MESLQLFAGDETLDEILDPEPDLLIDAIDSLNPKTGLLYSAWIRKIPIISSMGAALRTDPALIRCGDLFSTTNQACEKASQEKGGGVGYLLCVFD